MGDCQPSVLRLDTSRIPSLASLQRCGAHRPFSDSTFHFQNNRSLNLLGVRSSDRYRCEADGLYFHFCNFVFVTEPFFCTKNWGNQTCLTKIWTWISFWYTIVNDLCKIYRDLEIYLSSGIFLIFTLYVKTVPCDYGADPRHHDAHLGIYSFLC